MKTAKSYQELSAELDGILAKLQSPEVQVDELSELYKDGLKIITQLEDHLKQTENIIEKIKLSAAKEIE